MIAMKPRESKCENCRFCYNEDYCLIKDDYIDGCNTASCEEYVESADEIIEDSDEQEEDNEER